MNGIKPFRMPSENKKIADMTRRKPLRGMPRLKINKGLGAPPRIKL